MPAAPPDVKRDRRLWVLVVALYLLLRLPALLTYAPTYDEPIYIAAGKRFTMLRDPQAAAMLYHPPLAYHLTSLPLWFVDTPMKDWDPKGFGSQVGLDVLYDSKTNDGAPLAPETVLLLSRLPVLLVGLLGLHFSRQLGRRLAGERAGWLAAAAWAVYPECAAQSVQATTDLVAAVAALLLACSALRHFDRVAWRPQDTPWTHVALGAACGLAAMAKHTLLLPVAIVAAGAVVLRVIRSRTGTPQPPGPLGRFVVACLVAFGVLWAGYLCEIGPLAATSDGSHEHSATIARWTGLDAATVDDWLENVAVPMPTYWRSLADAFLDKARARGGTTWTGYLNGEWSDAGFLLYFPIALLVKTPVALLALMGAGISGWWIARRQAGYGADLCLLLFVLPFAAAVASRLNIGVRHLLPAVPFLMILGCAALALLWEQRPKLSKTVAIVLAWTLVFEWGANLLDPLPFANLPSGGPNRLHRYLADSNLEMGQDLWAFERWYEKEGFELAGGLRVICHGPQGLLEREIARRPYLASKREQTPWAIAESVSQSEHPFHPGMLAIGESVLVRPLGYSKLIEVEPMARVGRIRVYLTTGP